MGPSLWDDTDPVEPRPRAGHHGAMKPELLVLDAMGVIFEASDTVSTYLVPFAQERGSGLDRAAVRDLYLRSSVGEFDAEQLWRELGIRDPDAASEAYIKLFRLAPGALDFLGWAGRQRIRLACLSNDVGDWSLALRERHGLSSMIDLWVISGDVGSRKPDLAVFEALREACGVSFGAWVFVDDHQANLDAAARLGVTTVGFGPDVTATPRAKDFDELGLLISQLFDLQTG